LRESPVNPHTARVINLSLGTSTFSQTIASAITQALEKGVIVVAAAGNSGGNLAYPAAQQGVIAVTALAGPKTAYQPWYASKGLGTWLTAYGGDKTQDQNRDGIPDGILSTYIVNGEPGYGYDMGTSMAAPQVSGLAALALASGTPASLVKDTLANTSTDLGTKGYDANFGFGLAVARTVTATTPHTYVVATDQANTVIGWTLVQSDETYLLNNLIPGSDIEIFATSDEDGDGILAEAGELRSQPISLAVQSSSLVTVSDLLLNPTDGTKPVTLEARP
jgi:serine protease